MTTGGWRGRRYPGCDTREKLINSRDYARLDLERFAGLHDLRRNPKLSCDGEQFAGWIVHSDVVGCFVKRPEVDRYHLGGRRATGRRSPPVGDPCLPGRGLGG
jgi:hypothetical protein